jgi:transposase
MLTIAATNVGLNKSKPPHRHIAYIANKTQSVVMEKLYSETAYKRLIMESAQPITCSDAAKPQKEVPLQPSVKNHIGIDIAADTFATTVFRSPEKPRLARPELPNTAEGFKQLCEWLKEERVTPDNSVICMEATGVYGEAITYYLSAQGFKIAVEPPLKVKRAFDQDGHKTDPVDSAQIAEYAYRFFDELRFWKPLPETLERLKHYLTTRELLVKESVAVQNALKAYQRHVLKDPTLVEMHEKHLGQIKEHIAQVDKHMGQIIRQNPSLHQLALLLVSLCGVGMLLAVYMLVSTNAFQDITSYKQFAAFLGICPYTFQSGTSVKKKSCSRQFGPAYIRKLLHLAARSVATHQPDFRKYYHRKLAEGKCKKLVINNISNKLLKIAFAVIRDRKQYIKGYKSVSPLVLQNS